MHIDCSISKYFYEDEPNNTELGLSKGFLQDIYEDNYVYGMRVNLVFLIEGL